MARINMVYMTAASKEEAERIGNTLVESRLAACVNIIPSMNSIYVWKDKLQKDSETIIIAKTVESKVPGLIDKVKSIHSYECPCIVSIPVLDGNPDFLNWIVGEVA